MPPVAIPPDEHASPDEAMQAFLDLHQTDQLKLRQLARLRASGLSVSWEDLLQEALFRIFSGRRRWPRTVPFIAFLAQTLRSIASEERERAAAEPVTTEAGFAGDDAISLNELAVDTTTPESTLLTNRAVQEIETLFKADTEALHILHGLAHGFTPDEVRTASGMTQTQYGSAQKRMQRALARKFNTGA
jgi:DNA-directed RNA polymerase specialized sigma24 family protein